MEQYDQRIDDYIAKSADFAKPVLIHLRQLVHSASPLIKETIKWGHPHFDYKGPAFHMAAFKQHCAFNFWKRALMDDVYHLFADEQAMGHLGRITGTTDLPPDEHLLHYIQKTIELSDNSVKAVKKATVREPIPVPGYFAGALNQHPEAKAYFEKLSTSHQREYLEWITEARTEPTRQKRLQTAIEWLSEGKSRNWKYK